MFSLVLVFTSFVTMLSGMDKPTDKLFSLPEGPCTGETEVLATPPPWTITLTFTFLLIIITVFSHFLLIDGQNRLSSSFFNQGQMGSCSC